jgi:hypothetical protein
MLTPTNWPFCSAGPLDGTTLPSSIPNPIDKSIHITRNLSSIESFLKGAAISSSELGTSIRGELWLVLCFAGYNVPYHYQAVHRLVNSFLQNILDLE